MMYELLFEKSVTKVSVWTHFNFCAMYLQIFSRKIRFQLERAPEETSLIDRSGRTLKMEPLTTVGALEKYLLKMVGFSGCLLVVNWFILLI